MLALNTVIDSDMVPPRSLNSILGKLIPPKDNSSPPHPPHQVVPLPSLQVAQTPLHTWALALWDASFPHLSQLPLPFLDFLDSHSQLPQIQDSIYLLQLAL